MISSSMKVSFLLAAVVTPSLYATAPDGQPASVTVRYSDLDLSRAAGSETLYQRIRTAARHVCTSLEGRDLRTVQLHQHCMDDAVARAVSSVNQSQLTAYFQAHNAGKSLLLSGAALNTSRRSR